MRFTAAGQRGMCWFQRKVCPQPIAPCSGTASPPACRHRLLDAPAPAACAPIADQAALCQGQCGGPPNTQCYTYGPSVCSVNATGVQCAYARKVAFSSCKTEAGAAGWCDASAACKGVLEHSHAL